MYNVSDESTFRYRPCTKAISLISLLFFITIWFPFFLHVTLNYIFIPNTFNSVTEV